MSKCQDLLVMNHAPLAVAETILHDMMTEARSALDATIGKDELIAQCVGVKKMMDDVISLCRTTSDTTSAPSVSNGSDAFTWTCQQLLSTDWRGPPKTSNSYTKWGFAGKPGTSEDSGLINLGSATPVGMSTNASTCTTLEALKALNKSIMEAEAERARLGLS